MPEFFPAIFFWRCFRTRFPSESRWLDIASETISMLKGTPERLQKSSERYVSRCLNSLAIPSDELDGCLTMKNGLSDQISSICLKIPLDLVFVRKLNWSLLDPPPPSHEDSENNVRVSGGLCFAGTVLAVLAGLYIFKQAVKGTITSIFSQMRSDVTKIANSAWEISVCRMITHSETVLLLVTCYVRYFDTCYLAYLRFLKRLDAVTKRTKEIDGVMFQVMEEYNLVVE